MPLLGLLNIYLPDKLHIQLHQDSSTYLLLNQQGMQYTAVLVTCLLQPYLCNDQQCMAEICTRLRQLTN